MLFIEDWMSSIDVERIQRICGPTGENPDTSATIAQAEYLYLGPAAHSSL